MKVTIYHNPRCSKSRQTLALLHENSIEPEVVKYLESAPSVKTIEHILRLLELEPRQLMRRNEAAYSENDLDDSSLTHQQLVEAMQQNPKLIERPIVVVDDARAAIGRPPEKVIELLR